LTNGSTANQHRYHTRSRAALTPPSPIEVIDDRQNASPISVASGPSVIDIEDEDEEDLPAAPASNLFPSSQSSTPSLATAPRPTRAIIYPEIDFAAGDDELIGITNVDLCDIAIDIAIYLVRS
jgi:hypothetical protein